MNEMHIYKQTELPALQRTNSLDFIHSMIFPLAPP